MNEELIAAVIMCAAALCIQLLRAAPGPATGREEKPKQDAIAGIVAGRFDSVDRDLAEIRREIDRIARWVEPIRKGEE